MKKTVSILLVVFLFIACKQKFEPEDISQINGYWEVEKVVFDSIDDKEYSMNEVYDYFEIKNNRGIRKKVRPQLDGTFLVNDAFENVKVRFADEKVFLDYATPYMKWSEEIIAISAEKLVVINNQKMEYHYKKATAINVLGNGKTTK